MVTIHFTPQAWVSDNAVEVNPEGPLSFQIPVSDAQDEHGEWLPNRSFESDRLREHPLAPEWIRDWHGPFEIVIEGTDDD